MKKAPILADRGQSIEEGRSLFQRRLEGALGHVGQAARGGSDVQL